MRTCVSCQAVEAAVAAGNELVLEQELKRQAAAIARGRAPETQPACGGSCVDRVEHERIVKVLNARIAVLNTRVSRVLNGKRRKR